MATTSVGFDIFAKDRASATIDRIGNSADSSGHKFRAFGAAVKYAALGLAAGVGAAAVAGYKFAQSAAEDQQKAAVLAKQMQNSAHATKAQVAATEDWITKQGVAFGVADDDLRPALGRLVAVTHDVGKAQSLTSLAMNVSAGTGKSLSTVTTALAKAQTGSISGLSRLGVATKDAAGNTLTLKQVTAEMAKTYSGQAAKAADTAQGKFDRLKLAMSEAGESIGYKILPPLTSLATWLVNKGIPALGQFTDWVGKSFGPPLRAAGQVVMTQIVPALSRFGAGLLPIVQSLQSHLVPVLQTWGRTAETVVLPAIARLVGYLQNRLGPIFTQVAQVIATRVVPILSSLAQFFYGKVIPAVVAIAEKVGHNLKPVFDQLVATFQAKVLPSLVRLLAKFHEWQPTLEKVALFVVKVAGKVLEFASAVLGKVLPVLIRFQGFLIGQLVGTIIKVISQFIVGARQIIDFGRALVNAVQSVVRFQTAVGQKIGDALRTIAQIPGKVAAAVGNLGHLLWNAGAQVIQGLIDGIESKVSSLTSKLHSITSMIPLHKGPITKDRVLLTPAGQAIMEGLIAGITKGEVPLKNVLDRVTANVKAAGDKLKGLLQARAQFAAGFQNFGSSIFGADTTGDGSAPTVDSILTYASSQRDQAAQTEADVKRLVRMGLSKSLIKQMQAAGASGVAQLHALATGANAQQIKLLGSLDKQTHADYAGAGAVAGGAIFNDDIRQARHDKHLADAIAKALHDLIRGDKGEIHIHLEGHTLVEQIRKHQRKQGQKPSV